MPRRVKTSARPPAPDRDLLARYLCAACEGKKPSGTDAAEAREALARITRSTLKKMHLESCQPELLGFSSDRTARSRGGWGPSAVESLVQAFDDYLTTRSRSDMSRACNGCRRSREQRDFTGIVFFWARQFLYEQRFRRTDRDKAILRNVREVWHEAHDRWIRSGWDAPSGMRGRLDWSRFHLADPRAARREAAPTAEILGVLRADLEYTREHPWAQGKRPKAEIRECLDRIAAHFDGLSSDELMDALRAILPDRPNPVPKGLRSTGSAAGADRSKGCIGLLAFLESKGLWPSNGSEEANRAVDALDRRSAPAAATAPLDREATSTLLEGLRSGRSGNEILESLAGLFGSEMGEEEAAPAMDAWADAILRAWTRRKESSTR